MKRAHIVLVLAAVWLSGCGSRETNVQSGNREQVLHLANVVEPEDLDPHVTASRYCYFSYQALFEPMVTLDPVDLTLIPGLARNWSVSDDDKTYTFHLREEALFSNGDPITAGDLARSIQRVLTPTMDFNTPLIFFTKDFSSVGVLGRAKDHAHALRSLRSLRGISQGPKEAKNQAIPSERLQTVHILVRRMPSPTKSSGPLKSESLSTTSLQEESHAETEVRRVGPFGSRRMNRLGDQQSGLKVTGQKAQVHRKYFVGAGFEMTNGLFFA